MELVARLLLLSSWPMDSPKHANGSHFDVNFGNENYASKTTHIIIALARGNWRANSWN